MSARNEQETTVSVGRDDELVHIYTSNTVHLNRLRKDARFTEVRGGEWDGFFTIPSKQFNPLGGVKRKSKPMTEEQRAAAVERLTKARSSRA